MQKKESSITADTAAIIKGMVARGDKQMHVAVWAGVNQARVCEIAKGSGYGRRFLNVIPAPTEDLPPPGPYVILAKSRVDELELRSALVEKLEKLVAALKDGTI